MRNYFLTPRTEQDIDKRVSKILRDLRDPDPPLNISDVLHLLELDKQYYSTAKDGILAEITHRMKVGGKQVIQRPSIIFDVIKKLDLKALYLADRKRILTDDKLPKPKERWSDAHEVVHSILPWHDELMLGDDTETLSFSSQIKMEAEANFGAGRLLFLGDKFRDAAAGLEPTLRTVMKLKDQFGNSITTTLWRLVELSQVPAVGLVSGHPNRPKSDFDPAAPCRYLIRSRAFAEQFPRVDELALYALVKTYCGWTYRGPLGTKEVLVSDDGGTEHVFQFETFHNGYEALTLGICQGLRALTVQIPIVNDSLDAAGPDAATAAARTTG